MKLAQNFDSLSFLDIKSCRKNLSSVFTKNQHLVEFSPITKISFRHIYQKRELLHILLHRTFSICCDFKTFHLEVNHLKTILRKNNYPPNLIDSCIKSFLNKLYIPKVIVRNAPKRNVFVTLSFLKSASF